MCSPILKKVFGFPRKVLRFPSPIATEKGKAGNGKLETGTGKGAQNVSRLETYSLTCVVQSAISSLRS